MKKAALLVYIISGFITLSFGQGPPITADKPIMLGSNSVIVKTLSEFRNVGNTSYFRAPVIAHYLPTSNSLVGLHVPVVHSGNTTGLGDVEILGKLQFYRNDGTGKTLRVVAKTIQTLPTGVSLPERDISSGEYQSYLGIVMGYESTRYGISNELGYNLVPGDDFDGLHYKLGFGLPLLKPSYPVKQINLYFEYENIWYPEQRAFEIKYAQGLQYAIGRLTVESAVQLPIAKTFDKDVREFSVLLGTRYVF